MSDAARELLRYVQAALHEHDRRIRALEHRQAPWRASVRAGVEQRREVVVQLRESGLSYSQIAAAIGAGVPTVQRDLAATPHRRPARDAIMHDAAAALSPVRPHPRRAGSTVRLAGC